jgi:hypothetical protein
VQQHVFSTEIALLRAGSALPKGHKLEKLNAFVDADSGILRVGDQFYQVLNCHSTIDIHLFSVAILLILDYYRTLHLELVSDLTTSAFIAAFLRFTSQRGLCRHLYSDNATTFEGADSELRATLGNDGTFWTFIPPNIPYYGDLWKAEVESVKYHLKRAFHTHTLTFEEFTTALAKIEACLNSRPLCPLTSDPEDLNVLTPAHFLIGISFGIVIDTESLQVPTDHLRCL